jgi:hypothetical protein
MRKSVLTIMVLVSGAITTTLLAQPPAGYVPIQSSDSSVKPLQVVKTKDTIGYRQVMEDGKVRMEPIVADVHGTAHQTAFTYYFAHGSDASKGIYRDLNTGKLVMKPMKDLDDSTKESVGKLEKELASARDVIRSAKSTESEKADAKKLLGELLDLQFEADLVDRQEQLKSLEKQLDDLRTQLQRRRDAKSKLIEMKLVMMENESSGLGFPDAWNHSPHGGHAHVYRGPVILPSTPNAPSGK